MEKRAFPETIEAERIVLKKHEVATAERMFRCVDEDRERLGRFLPWVKFSKSVADQLDYIKHTHAEWEKGELFDYSLFRKEEGAYLGNMGLHHLAWEHNRCEIGYWIAGPFEGKGYVTEAVFALERAAFQLGFNRVEICCSSLNERSARVPRSCGYHLDGIMRQDTVEHGAYRDTLVFSKLRSEHEPRMDCGASG